MVLVFLLDLFVLQRQGDRFHLLVLFLRTVLLDPFDLVGREVLDFLDFLGYQTVPEVPYHLFDQRFLVVLAFRMDLLVPTRLMGQVDLAVPLVLVVQAHRLCLASLTDLFLPEVPEYLVVRCRLVDQVVREVLGLHGALVDLGFREDLMDPRCLYLLSILQFLVVLEVLAVRAILVFHYHRGYP